MILGEINLVAESHFQALRQWTGNRGFLPAVRGRRSLGVVLVRQCNANANNASAPLSITNDLLNGGTIDLADRRQERPLIGIRNAPFVDKYAVSKVSRPFLQR